MFSSVPGRNRLLLIFLPVGIILTAALVSVSLSMMKVSAADCFMKELLEGIPVDPSSELALHKLRGRSESLFLESYSDSELLAAALLLGEQDRDEAALLFLNSLAEKKSLLSPDSRDLLLARWTSQGAWDLMRRRTSDWLGGGDNRDNVRNHYWKALWKTGGRERTEVQTTDGPGESFSGQTGWEASVQYLRNHTEYPDPVLLAGSVDLEIVREILTDLSPAGINPADEEALNLILTGRTLTALGDYSPAEEAFREFWDSRISGEDRVLPEALLMDIRNAVRYSGQSGEWVSRLAAWPGRDKSGYAAAFLTAGLFEETGETGKAVEWYGRARDTAPDGERRKRAEWYHLRLLTRTDPEGAFLYIRDNAPEWGTDDYFDDILDEFYSSLIRMRSWTLFRDTVGAVWNSSLREPAAQGIFLLKQMVDAGLTEDPEGLTDRADQRIRGRDALGYYALMSSPETWPSPPEGFSADNDLSERELAMDEVYRHLLHGRAVETAWAFWSSRQDRLSPETVLQFCRELKDRGESYKSIRFSGYWFYRWPAESAVSLIPYLFPREESLPVDLLGRDFSLPPEMILGIIRRESAFMRSVESHAGAVGLMQLMPSTAEDLAARNRIDEWDLRDPDDNLRLGVLYLDWLVQRPWTGHYADVLAAYNGGGGNLRSWKRRYGYTGEELFVQSIPYRETREYVRKVIVASASYRYLSTGKPPGDWIHNFYSPFSQS